MKSICPLLGHLSPPQLLGGRCRHSCYAPSAPTPAPFTEPRCVHSTQSLPDKGLPKVKPNCAALQLLKSSNRFKRSTAYGRWRGFRGLPFWLYLSIPVESPNLSLNQRPDHLAGVPGVWPGWNSLTIIEFGGSNTRDFKSLDRRSAHRREKSGAAVGLYHFEMLWTAVAFINSFAPTASASLRLLRPPIEGLSIFHELARAEAGKGSADGDAVTGLVWRCHQPFGRGRCPDVQMSAAPAVQ
jgi:hypothetical protein